LTLDILGAGSGTIGGNAFTKLFDFHFVGQSSQGGAQLSSASVTLFTLANPGNAQTYNILNPSLYSIGTIPNSPTPNNGPYHVFFGLTGGPEIMQQFFSYNQFQNLDNNSGSFSAVSNKFAFSNFDIDTSGGHLVFKGALRPGVLFGTDTGDAVSAVPEISTWMMMLLGFAGIGLAAYRRAKKPMTAIAAT
jgi:hypothetical protein